MQHHMYNIYIVIYFAGITKYKTYSLINIGTIFVETVFLPRTLENSLLLRNGIFVELFA